MSHMKRVTVQVSFEVPSPTRKTDCSDYVRDAVGAWRGQLRPPDADGPATPGDPMWYLDPESVRVRHVSKK